MHKARKGGRPIQRWDIANLKKALSEFTLYVIFALDIFIILHICFKVAQQPYKNVILIYYFRSIVYLVVFGTLRWIPIVSYLRVL